jgi:ferric enterobactin receptor
MKSLLIISLFILLASACFSQALLKGTVTESLSNESLVYATVNLTDSTGEKVISRSLTDTAGKFTITNIIPGKYRLKISYQGIETNSFDLNLKPEHPDIDMIFKVTLNPTQLNIVEVTARRQIIEMTADKISYNVDRDQLAKNRSLADVMKKVPLVSIDFRGVPSLKGNEKVKVQINGRAISDYGIPADQALKMIPTSSVSSIEVVTTPGATADGDNTAGIINIVTKNTFALGSKLNIGAETTIGNSYSIKPNMNFTYGIGKLNFTLSSTYTDFKTVGESEQSYGIKDEYLQTQYGNLAYKGNPLYINSGLFYEANKRNNFNVGLAYSAFPYHFNQNLNTTQQNLNEASIFNRDALSKITNKSFSTNVEYKHKFNKPGSEVSFSGLYTDADQDNDNTNVNTFISGSQQPVAFELSNNNSKSNTLIFQSDVKVPFANSKLVSGLKLIRRRLSSIYNSSIESSDGIGTDNSDIYKYTQNIYAGYSQFQYNLPKKWVLIGGVRYERTTNEAEFKSTDTQVDHNFDSFLPSFVIGKSFKSTSISFTYTYKLARPGITLLNPFENYVNANTVASGNPDLNPEYNNRFSFAFGYNGSKLSIYGDISADFWRDYITRVNEVSGNTNRITYRNIGTYREIGASVNVNYSATKNLSFALNSSVNYFTYDALLNATYNKKYKANAGLISSYSFKGGYNLQGEYYLYTDSYSFQTRSEIPNTSMLTLNKLLLQDRLTIGVGIINPIQNKLHYNVLNMNSSITSTTNQNIQGRGVLINLNYQFGNARISGKSRNSIKDNDLKEGANSPIGN